jgi:hypothetical protein
MPADLSQLSDEQLEVYRDLLQKKQPNAPLDRSAPVRPPGAPATVPGMRGLALPGVRTAANPAGLVGPPDNGLWRKTPLTGGPPGGGPQPSAEENKLLASATDPFAASHELITGTKAPHPFTGRIEGNPKESETSVRLGGASKMGRDIAAQSSGLIVPAAIAHPARVALGLVGGTLGGAGGEYGSQLLGAGEGTSHAIGDVTATLAGGAAAKLPDAFKVDPRIALTRGLRPTPSNEGFPKAVPQSIAGIKASNPGFVPKVENGELNLAPAANKAIEAHNAALEPYLQRAEGTTVPHEPIVRATQRAIGEMLPSEQGPSAQRLVDRAEQDFSELGPRQMLERLRLINQRLSSYYNRNSAGQSALLADIPDNVLKAQAEAIRETLYNHLDPENAGAGPRDIQARAGHIIDIRDAANRRGNAIVAEQPLTAFGKVWDPIKGFVRSLIPALPTGSGIAYAEGSEGRSLPHLRRAFNAVDEQYPAFPQPDNPHLPGSFSPFTPVAPVSRQLGPASTIMLPSGQGQLAQSAATVASPASTQPFVDPFRSMTRPEGATPDWRPRGLLEKAPIQLPAQMRPGQPAAEVPFQPYQDPLRAPVRPAGATPDQRPAGLIGPAATPTRQAPLKPELGSAAGDILNPQVKEAVIILRKAGLLP